MAKSKKPRKPYNPKKTQHPLEADPMAGAWDDVAEISESIDETIGRTARSIHLACDQLVLSSATPDEIQAIKTHTTTLKNDLVSLVERQKTLNESRKQRRGESTNPDDHTDAIAMFCDYLEIAERIEEVVLPTLGRLNDVSSQVLDRHIGDGSEVKEVSQDDSTTSESEDRTTAELQDLANGTEENRAN